MALIHDHHLAGQPQLAQHQVLLFECRHQQLVNGTDDKVRQQGLPVALKPAMYQHAAFGGVFPVGVLLGHGPAGEQLAVILVQLSHAVRQADRVDHILRLCLGPISQAVKDAVGRGLGRQAKEQPTRLAAVGKELRGGQRRLRLAHPHLRLDDKQPRHRDLVGCLQHGLLQTVGQKSKSLPERTGVHAVVGRFPRGCQIQPLPGTLHPRGVIRFAPRFLHRDQREIGRIAGDPVRHGQQAGQQQFGRDGQCRQFCHVRKAAFLQSVIQHFLTHRPPDGLLPPAPVVVRVVFQLFVDGIV